MVNGPDRADPSQSAAVLFGVETYPNTSLPPVQAAPRNVEGLRRSFADGELWGLRGKYRLVIEFDSAKGGILDSIANAARIPDHHGLLVIYFVGHAEYDGGMLYLAASDANLGQKSTLLTIPELVKAAEQSAAARKLLILDCCYAGAAARDLAPEIQRVNEAAGWLLLAATDTVPARDAALDEELTPFTAALLAAFDGSPEAGRSLSPKAVLTHAATLLDGHPTTNHAAWEDDPWLRNRQYQPPPARPSVRPGQPAGSPGAQRGLPGLLLWPEGNPRFVGRKRELSMGVNRLVPGGVLTVTGPLKSGKDYYADEMIADVRARGMFDEDDCLLGLEIPIGSTEEPVLESLARALSEHLDERDAAEPVAMASVEARRRRLVTSLAGRVADRRLLILIDCTRLGPDPTTVRSELDTLLQDRYFHRAATVVKARTKLGLTGDGQLRDLPPIPLGELSYDEAAELLGKLLDAEQIGLDRVDLKQDVLQRLNDPLVRLPGVLVNGVDGFVTDYQPSVTGDVLADNLADALLNRSVPTVLRALRDAGCLQLRQPSPNGHRHGPLAVLVSWALTEGLPVSQQVLQSVDVGLRTQVERLTDARVLLGGSRDGSRWYDIGPASRNTLRLLLLVLLGGDEVSEDVDSTGMIEVRRTIGGFLGPDAEPAPEELDETLAKGATALRATASRLSPESVPGLVQAVRWAVGWIDENAPGRLPRLRAALAVVNAYDGDAMYLSVTPEKSAAPVSVDTAEPVLSPDTAALERLLEAAARLTVTVRQHGPVAAVLERLMPVASEAAEAIVECPAELVSYHLLKSVDTALFLAGRRLRSTTSLLGARERAADALYRGVVATGASRTDRLVIVLSWLLNTADTQVDAGRLESARDTRGKAEEIFALLPDARDLRETMTRLQMEHRLGRAQARCAMSSDERIAGLGRAFERTSAGLELSGSVDELALWSSRLVETAALLALELRAADEQKAFAADVLDRLTAAWRSYGPWPVAVRVAVWQFLYGTFHGLVEPERRLVAARKALSLLLRNTSGVEEGQQTLLMAQVEAHMFLARTLRINDQLAEAITEARRALSLADRCRTPDGSAEGAEIDPRAYLLWLRTLQSVIWWSPPTDSSNGERTRLKREIGIAQEWLRGQESTTAAHATLDLWCLRTLWAEEGNLTVASAREGEEFSRLPRETKQQRIEEAYRKRRKSLQGHETTYGPSIEFCRMQVRLERQYRRWLSVIWREDVDNGAVWALFRRAEELWPDNPTLLASIAEFNRYIWRYGDAVGRYQRLALTAANATERLRAVYGAVEAAVTQAQYDLRLSAQRREQMLRDSRRLLDDEIHGRSLSEEFALLRHRIALELEEEVDWDRVDRVFDEIIGDDYSKNIGQYLTTRRYGSDDGGSVADRLSPEARKRLQNLSRGGVPAQTGNSDGAEPPASTVVEDEETSSSLGDLLLQNFTDVDLLQALGSIYLRRAELAARRRDADTAADSTRRAFDCFDACRILQQDRTGKTPLVTKFLSGRAILLAAQVSDSPDPFRWQAPPPYGSWLEYAMVLLGDCKAAAVGGFGKECSRRYKEIRTVLSQLGQEDGPPR